MWIIGQWKTEWAKTTKISKFYYLLVKCKILVRLVHSWCKMHPKWWSLYCFQTSEKFNSNFSWRFSLYDHPWYQFSKTRFFSKYLRQIFCVNTILRGSTFRGKQEYKGKWGNEERQVSLKLHVTELSQLPRKCSQLLSYLEYLQRVSMIPPSQNW